MKSRDVWIRVGEQRAVVGPPRHKRYKADPPGIQPPIWLLLGPRPLDGSIAPTKAHGSFELEAGEIARVRVSAGLVSEEMCAALLEVGRAQWALRKRES